MQKLYLRIQGHQGYSLCEAAMVPDLRELSIDVAVRWCQRTLLTSYYTTTLFRYHPNRYPVIFYSIQHTYSSTHIKDTNTHHTYQKAFYISPVHSPRHPVISSLLPWQLSFAASVNTPSRSRWCSLPTLNPWKCAHMTLKRQPERLSRIGWPLLPPCPFLIGLNGKSVGPQILEYLLNCSTKEQEARGNSSLSLVAA